MAKSKIPNTKAALKSRSVTQAGKGIVRGMKKDGKMYEQKLKQQAQKQLDDAKKGFQRSANKVERYIQENPKKALAFAAGLAAVATFALTHRKKA